MQQGQLQYDANGNVSRRAGQTLVFDIGNRLLSSSQGLTFAYDGHGRRTQVAYTGSGASRLQMYSLEGRLVYEQYVLAPGAAPQRTAYIYLHDRLVAQYRPEAGQDALQFIHTDALGTPVVRSRASAPVQEVAGSRRVHEPYGFVEKHIAGSGVNYTGHFFDSETGLVYMQQRYYDPIAGRFLSIDPVVTDARTGSSFNRYVYGNNNPYKFKDPDGRFAIPLIPFAVDALIAWGARTVFVASAAAVANIAANQSSSDVGSGQQGTSPPPGTQGSSQGCIYCVGGENTSSGRDYVGSTENMGQRAKDTSDGRNRQGAEVVGTYDKGDKQGRRNAEQQAINDRGGKDKLDNKRNEVAPKDWGDRGIKPPEKSN